jgi:hypothetical protein
MELKTAKELYDVKEEDVEYGFYNYQPILDSFGDILCQKDEVDYQGDSWVLYEKDGKIGYLCFGWGSCSGCDSLQACQSYNDVDELIEKLYFQIRWFDSIQEAYEYFINKNWEGDYSWSIEEFQEFIKEVKDILRQKLASEM